MKVAILLVQVPFLRGGAEAHAEALRRALVARGVETDIVTIPFKWYPPERILDCMLAGRLVDVTEVNGHKIDRVIAMKFPAYYAPHPNKVGWVIHQHRQAYELFGTEFGDLHQTPEGRAVANEIRAWDNRLLPELRPLFTNSRTVSNRLLEHNGIESEPLYPPPLSPEQFRPGEYGNYVLYPGRFDTLKRQHLLVEAVGLSRGRWKAVFIGPTDGPYAEALKRRVVELGVEDRVRILGNVPETEKASLYAGALAVYNGVYQEDYGYVTIEAFLSAKPVLTHHDSGGPTEFVEDGRNGYLCEADPSRIAARFDWLEGHRAAAREAGENGKRLIADRRIDWDHTIERLLA